MHPCHQSKARTAPHDVFHKFLTDELKALHQALFAKHLEALSHAQSDADSAKGTAWDFQPAAPKRFQAMEPTSSDENKVMPLEMDDFDDNSSTASDGARGFQFADAHAVVPGVVDGAPVEQTVTQLTSLDRTGTQLTIVEHSRSSEINYESSQKSDPSASIFKLHPRWATRENNNSNDVSNRKSARGRQRFELRRSLSGGSQLAIEEDPEEEEEDLDHPDIIMAKGRIRHVIIHPYSIPRGTWDLLNLVFVGHDMVTLPLAFFDLPKTTFAAVMMWTIRIFWTCDLPLNFLTGYVMSDGIIEMRPQAIVRRYLSTWFLLDLILVLTDWLETLGSAFGVIRIAKATRALRIIRMLRLMRVAKMKKILAAILERFPSEKIYLLVDIVQIIAIMIFFAHMVACIWYGIGSQDGERVTWVGYHEIDSYEIGLKYVVSLHWSLSQFTGGMDEIRAHNLEERSFAVCVFLIFFIMSALFVSSLTSSLTRLHIISSHQSRQVQKLRRFLYQNGIQPQTTLRIQRNALHALAEHSRFMPESEVELLSLVSEPLRLELRFEMYSDAFSTHFFFGRFMSESPRAIRKVCHCAMDIVLVSRGDVLFSVGELPQHPKAYIFLEGEMRYVSMYGKPYPLTMTQWVTEQALWCAQFHHRGVLTALSDCRLHVLDALKFIDIVDQFDYPTCDPRDYAWAYVNDMVELGNKMTDLEFHTEHREDAMQKLRSGTEVSHMFVKFHLAVSPHKRRRTSIG